MTRLGLILATLTALFVGCGIPEAADGNSAALQEAATTHEIPTTPSHGKQIANPPTDGASGPQSLVPSGHGETEADPVCNCIACCSNGRENHCWERGRHHCGWKFSEDFCRTIGWIPIGAHCG